MLGIYKILLTIISSGAILGGASSAIIYGINNVDKKERGVKVVDESKILWESVFINDKNQKICDLLEEGKKIKDILEESIEQGDYCRTIWSQQLVKDQINEKKTKWWVRGRELIVEKLIEDNKNSQEINFWLKDKNERVNLKGINLLEKECSSKKSKKGNLDWIEIECTK